MQTDAEVPGVSLDVDQTPEAGKSRPESPENEDITDESEKRRDKDNRKSAAAADAVNHVATPIESNRKIDQVPRRKLVNYSQLYDEQLIANNMRCYVQ